MSLSVVILICGSALVLLGLLNGFFGYKLARFLLPVSGFVLAEGLLYIFVYDLLKLDTLSTWLFFAGGGVAVYLILFFLKRIAGFFTGAVAGGLFAVLVIYAAGLQEMPLVYPAVFTVFVMVGLLTAVYQRGMVVAATAIFGGCCAAYAGLYLYLIGINPTSIVVYNNLLVPFEGFLKNHAYLVGGAALVLSAVGMLVQFRWTADRQLLSNNSEQRFIYRKRNGFADSV